MAKKIVVLPDSKDGPEIALEFLQRASGQETPYWVGTIHARAGRKWTPIGDFENNGQGGATMVRGFGEHRELPKRFARAVTEVCDSLGEKAFEPEDDVVAYAEEIGYRLRCKPADFTLADYIAMIVCGGPNYSGRPKTEAQIEAAKVATTKYLTIIAQGHAAKGKTAVRVGDSQDLLIVSTRDRRLVESVMTERGVESFAILA